MCLTCWQILYSRRRKTVDDEKRHVIKRDKIANGSQKSETDPTQCREKANVIAINHRLGLFVHNVSREIIILFLCLLANLGSYRVDIVRMTLPYAVVRCLVSVSLTASGRLSHWRTVGKEEGDFSRWQTSGFNITTKTSVAAKKYQGHLHHPC